MRIKFFLFFITWMALFLSGCLKKEKRQLTDKWKLVEYNAVDATYGGTPDCPQVMSYSFDGSNMTETFKGKVWESSLSPPFKDTAFIHTYSYSLNLIIEKHFNKRGNYTQEVDKGGVFSSKSDTWVLDESDARKTKIIFDNWGGFDIYRLSNKEMILKVESYYNYHDGHTSENTAMYRFQKK